MLLVCPSRKEPRSNNRSLATHTSNPSTDSKVVVADLFHAGIPIYNVIALNYTPVVQKNTSVKRKGRGRQLEQKENGKVANAFSHDATKEPPAKKQKTSGPRLELPHSRLTVTSDNSRNGPEDSRKSSRTAKLCTRVSAISSDTRKQKESIRKKHSLFSNSIRQWRRRRKRKRFALRLKKEGDGCKNNPAPLMAS